MFAHSVNLGLTGSPFQGINLFHVNRGPVAEKGDQNRQTNCRFRCGNRQDKKGENLPGYIPIIVGKGDKINVYRQQYQLNAHQNDDHVAPIQKDAKDTRRKQNRTQNQVMMQ
jgi:hypothetical protein